MFDLSVADGTDRVLTWEAIGQSLGQLPATQREAVVGMYLHGYSAAELADALGCQEDAIHQRARRGAARLRTLLGAHGIHGATAVSIFGLFAAAIRRRLTQARVLAVPASSMVAIVLAVIGGLTVLGQGDLLPAGPGPLPVVGHESSAMSALAGGNRATPWDSGPQDTGRVGRHSGPFSAPPEVAVPAVGLDVEADGDGRVGVVATVEGWIPLLGEAGGSSHVEFYCDPDQPPSLVLDAICEVIRLLDAQGTGTVNDAETVVDPTV